MWLGSAPSYTNAPDLLANIDNINTKPPLLFQVLRPLTCKQSGPYSRTRTAKMADPELATSSTKRISYAGYNYASPAEMDADPDQTTVDFHFRRGDIKAFQVVKLTNLDSARATIATKLDTLSTSPTRVVLLNDENKVDMPEVSLGELERILKEETVLGAGTKRQVFVIVYDSDPTAEESEGATIAIPHQGRRQKVVVKECCVVS